MSDGGTDGMRGSEGSKRPFRTQAPFGEAMSKPLDLAAIAKRAEVADLSTFHSATWADVLALVAEVRAVRKRNEELRIGLLGIRVCIEQSAYAPTGLNEVGDLVRALLEAPHG